MAVRRSRVRKLPELSSLEICAGAGGQALGLEGAGFLHQAAYEIDPWAFSTLSQNRPQWNPMREDVREISGKPYKGVSLFAGGVPCPPFSVAGKQLGANDDRDLFPTALHLIGESKPDAVLLENVPGFATARFADYRESIIAKLLKMKYSFVDWQILNACNFGVPQLRPRFVLVALKGKAASRYQWPSDPTEHPTVGSRLVDLMGARGWKGAKKWALRARGIGPTLVGGSKLHGGPDLGPTRAKLAWRELGVDGMGVANEAPPPDFPLNAAPKLTVRMAARVQGFPDSWEFAGKKTAQYRQIGNAFPPPVARAVGLQIASALLGVSVADLLLRANRDE